MWWTLAASITASATALVIAFFAYPWQKKKDRRQQLLHEKRDAYRRFIEVANGYFMRVAIVERTKDFSFLSEHYVEVVSVSSNLIIYAPKAVIKACQEYSQSLFEYGDFVQSELGREGFAKRSNASRDEVFKKARVRRRAAMLSIREDLGENSGREVTEAVNAFFVLTPTEEDTL